MQYVQVTNTDITTDTTPDANDTFPKPKNQKPRIKASTSFLNPEESKEIQNLGWKIPHTSFIPSIIGRYPLTSFLLTFLIAVLPISILVFQFFAGEVYLSLSQDLISYDQNNIQSIRYDSLKQAGIDNNRDQNEQTRRRTLLQTNANVQTNIEPDERAMLWVYDSGIKGNAFSASHIRRIRQFEKDFESLDGFNQYCYDEQCPGFISPTRFFYPSSWDDRLAEEVVYLLQAEGAAQNTNLIVKCRRREPEDIQYCDQRIRDMPSYQYEQATRIVTILDDLIPRWDGKAQQIVKNVQGMADFIAAVRSVNAYRYIIEGYAEKTFNTTNPTSTLTRSTLILEKYARLPASATGDPPPSFTEFLKQPNTRAFIEENINPSDKSKKYYLLEKEVTEKIETLLINDVVMGLVSFAIVFVYIWFSFQSMFLAVTGTLQVVLAVPIAVAIYSTMFGYTYQAPLNSLIVFVAAAVGVDDLFVFVGYWNASLQAGPGVVSKINKRMEWTWRRSILSMGVTSFSTALSFFASCLSPLTSICSFGLISGISILADYFLVNTVFATAILLYAMYWEKQSNTTSSKKTLTQQAMQWYRENHWGAMPGDALRNTFDVFGKIWSVILFTWEKYITSKQARVITILATTLWLILASITVAGLDTASSAMQYLRPQNPLQRAADALVDNFHVSSTTPSATIFFVYGIKNINRKNVNFLKNISYIGTPEFDLEPIPDQSTPRHTNCGNAINNKIKQVSRYVYESQDANITSLFRYEETGDPVILGIYPSSQFSTSPTYEAAKEPMDKVTGYNGTHYTHLVIAIPTPDLLPRVSYPRNTILPKYESYNKIADMIDEDNSIRNACEMRIDSSFHIVASDQHFVFMETQRIFKTTFVQGVAAGFGIALALTLVTTRFNLFVTFCAAVSVAATIISVIAFVGFFGWEIGVIEGALFTALSGFAVDYTIHLSIHVSHTSNQKEEEEDDDDNLTDTEGSNTKRDKVPLLLPTIVKKDKTDENKFIITLPKNPFKQSNTNKHNTLHEHKIKHLVEAFDTIGKSNVNAAVTSILACIPMFMFCYITVFTKFAFFLIMTSTFSIIFSATIFPALYLLV